MRLPTSAALGSALLALAAATTASGAPTISEYSLEAKAGEPLGIVSGPEGNLWFTQSGSESAIGRITPGGVITLHKTGGSSPRDIARGPYGNLWYAVDAGAGELDPFTGVFNEYTLGAPASNASGITAGPEGDLWFTVEGGPEALLGRIVPGTGATSEFKVPTKNSKPAHITVGPEGDLWFTESNGPEAIGRFDPTTEKFTEYKALTPNSNPSGITTGPEGEIWFTEASNPGRIGRIDPTSGSTIEFSAGLAAGSPREITKGADGNLYFTESAGDGALGRITPSGVITEFTTGLSPKGEPWGITTGPEGNIWFTERDSPGKIGELQLDSPISPASPTGPSAPQQPASVTGDSLHPVIGRSAVVVPVSGSVSVKSPSSAKFVSLTGAVAIPIGSVIDATRGVLRLTTALDTHGGRQTATVWDGSFQVDQSRTGNGKTQLSLRGALPFCASPRPGRAISARVRRARTRRLWTQDEHGRYSTYGANSVATVLGTRWETVDSCAGTLTRVLRGRVRVRDLERHVTVLVSAGHSYLSRA